MYPLELFCALHQSLMAKLGLVYVKFFPTKHMFL